MLYDDVSGSTRERRTVCISTQAGCAMGCVFCATGQAGLARNLTAGEIVAQVLAAARWLAHSDEGPTTNDETSPRVRPSSFVLRPLTNIVVMGMGEPMANYDRTWEALRTITDPDAFGLGARHVTVSTVGLPQGIRRMAERAAPDQPGRQPACAERRPCAPGWCRSTTATRSRKSWRPCETTSPAPTGG